MRVATVAELEAVKTELATFIDGTIEVIKAQQEEQEAQWELLGRAWDAILRMAKANGQLSKSVTRLAELASNPPIVITHDPAQINLFGEGK